jgi:hypothetical protein
MPGISKPSAGQKAEQGCISKLANLKRHKSTMQGWHLLNESEVLSCTVRSNKSEQRLAEMVKQAAAECTCILADNMSLTQSRLKLMGAP